MDDQLFFKIIKDLEAVPESHKFLLTLARINEPLLDKRLKSFSFHVDANLPNASQVFWSNGSTLLPGKFEWMGSIIGSTLVVSLNSVHEKNHTQLMGFGLKKVFRNLDYLHELKEKNSFKTNVVLNAPYQSLDSSGEFLGFCRKRWPQFTPNVLPFFKWQGDIAAGEKERLASQFFSDKEANISEQGCGQWFDLHILANGQVTKCCIDEAGHKNDDYSVALNSVLDLYKKSLPLREHVPSRREVEECRACTHLG